MVVVVGNKTDLVETDSNGGSTRQVEYDEGKQWAQSQGKSHQRRLPGEANTI